MIQFIKKFSEWLTLKKQLDERDNLPPLFNEGEIWWCHVGENIGTEISGKSRSFTRPVLILKKYNSKSFYALPLTTKEKTGTWYLPIVFNGRRQTVILTQGRRYDYRRLQNKMGSIPEIFLYVAQFAHAGLHSSSKKKTLLEIR